MRFWRSPTSLIWIAVHGLLLLLGMLAMTTEGENIFGNVWAQSVGSSLTATGIAGLVLYLYVRSSERLQQQLEVVTRAGIVGVFRHRSVRIKEEYDKRVANAKQIDVIGLGLSAFREDCARHFAEWSRRADVRILLIDPDFPTKAQSLADIRDLEEGVPKGKIRKDVEAFEAEIAANTAIDRSRFQIRRMRTIPAVNLFRMDGDILWGPYLMDQSSRNTPTVHVTSGGFLYDELVRHFEETWKAATPNP
jgi:hypothetical protein